MLALGAQARGLDRGQFARDFIAENRAGAPMLKAMRRLGQEHPIEQVGERLRAMMPFLDPVTVEPVASRT